MRRALAVSLAATALAAPTLAPTLAWAQGELLLKIVASPATHYEMLCHVRTYKTPQGTIANRYGVVQSGPYADTVPSPNAQCQIKIVGGPGPITVSLSKPGVTRTVTVKTPGPAGQQPLVIF